ncbi:MAG TPA: hypothetical protein VGB24_14385 [Longimicrobium sp.]|uniref:hypothetical protein n=1 Tax=Longimicrobium sp. TaxID=2029185 RepID=UPI002ED84345
MIELVVEVVVWLLLEGLWRLPLRLWVSVGLVAVGVVATNAAFEATGPTRPMLFALTGACLVLSPASLILWANSPRRPRPRRR